MSALLYLVAAAAVGGLCRRFVQSFTPMAGVVLLLLPLCFTGSALLRGRVYAPIDSPFGYGPLADYAERYGARGHGHNPALSDLHVQMIPWQHVAREALRNGEWPLWNPYQRGGTILAANMQSAPYDWVQLLGLLLDHPDALTFGATMTFFLAGLFAFAFARSLGCGEVASLIGAAGFSFCAMLAFFVQWPLGRTWTYLPLGIDYVRTDDDATLHVKLNADYSASASVTVPQYLPHRIANGPGQVRFEPGPAGTLLMNVRMDGDGWLVTSQPGWRGWRAYLDGRRVQTRMANHAFVGVFVPRGEHRVRLVYLPESFTRGRAISVATAAFILAWIGDRAGGGVRGLSDRRSTPSVIPRTTALCVRGFPRRVFR